MRSRNHRTRLVEFDINLSGANIFMYVCSDTPTSLQARAICHVAQVYPIPHGPSRARVYSRGETTGMGAVLENGARHPQEIGSSSSTPFMPTCSLSDTARRVIWPNQYPWLLQQNLIKWEGPASWGHSVEKIRNQSKADSAAKFIPLIQVS